LKKIKRKKSSLSKLKLRSLKFDELSDDERYLIEDIVKFENQKKRYEKMTEDEKKLHYEKFRINNNIKKCHFCGRNMNGQFHHFICDKCHDNKYNDDDNNSK